MALPPPSAAAAAATAAVASLRRDLETGLLPQLAEVRQLLASNPGDAEVEALLAETEREAAAVCAQVNAHDRALGFAPGVVCEVRCPEGDAGAWLACRIDDIRAADATSRIRFFVSVVGFRHREAVLAERLRAWGPPQTPLEPGLSVHAVHPSDRLFRPAKVVRAAPGGPVAVVFLPPEAGAPSKAPAGAAVSAILRPNATTATDAVIEVARHEVFLGPLPETLRRTAPALSADDQKKRDDDRRDRKRDRQRQQREQQQSSAAQAANDWRAAMAEDDDAGFDQLVSRRR